MEKNEFLALINLCAMHKSRTVSELEAVLWLKAFADYPPDLIKPVLISFFEAGEYPTIAEFRSRVEPQKRDPNEVVAEITRAISKFGMYASFDKEVSKELSFEAQNVIHACGSWALVCQSIDYSNAHTVKAHWRELAREISGKPQLLSAKKTIDLVI